MGMPKMLDVDGSLFGSSTLQLLKLEDGRSWELLPMGMGKPFPTMLVVCQLLT